MTWIYIYVCPIKFTLMYRQKHIELYSINTAYWSHTCIVWTSQLHSHNKDSGSMDSVLLLVITQVSWSSPYGSEHKLQGVFELPASEPFWPWSQLLCSMNHGAGLTQCFLTVSWAGAWFSVCVSTASQWTPDQRFRITVVSELERGEPRCTETRALREATALQVWAPLPGRLFLLLASLRPPFCLASIQAFWLLSCGPLSSWNDPECAVGMMLKSSD